MMSLGPHAMAVLSAYAVSLLLLAVLIGASLRRDRRARRALEEAERDHG
ncbi:hypothetical protein OG2516_02249 [Oceanicola granulosus HTCC2516]|uniref:Heme exporter protein D n=1 Tax=Oceanicola granulosus (strain ATCC BAA-861 / DSM 15982 / KCTC 12143 / HTCC2516) TaxID=314256 RepID=Q2CHS4_OCEGH|nr:heme exporter protein CcmD [Oceanicola granulosus]EAR52220.1 hypothetical protein OG2516_02249 [Oceanicola granulosus HTCC2516]